MTITFMTAKQQIFRTNPALLKGTKEFPSYSEPHILHNTSYDWIICIQFIVLARMFVKNGTK
jgi:hypothetical protein